MVNPPKKKTPRGITQVGPRNYRARIMVDGAHHSLGYFRPSGMPALLSTSPVPNSPEARSPRLPSAKPPPELQTLAPSSNKNRQGARWLNSPPHGLHG